MRLKNKHNTAHYDFDYRKKCPVRTISGYWSLFREKQEWSWDGYMLIIFYVGLFFFNLHLKLIFLFILAWEDRKSGGFRSLDCPMSQKLNNCWKSFLRLKAQPFASSAWLCSLGVSASFRLQVRREIVLEPHKAHIIFLSAFSLFFCCVFSGASFEPKALHLLAGGYSWVTPALQAVFSLLRLILIFFNFGPIEYFDINNISISIW